MRTAWTASCLLAVMLPCALAPAESIEFNRDIRPILADKCFACHGPAESSREAELRLDERASAVEDRGGYHVIRAGQPAESELLARVSATDEYERMPPPEYGKQLSEAEITLVRRWIEQGAAYQPHWSLTALERPPVPAVANVASVATPVDAFVLSRLEEQAVEPAPVADPRTLIRRLAFDLTGLPPGPEMVRAFCADDSPAAYRAVVDQLLASPHFGERMAVYWLDLVRYADTLGYHGDQPRSVWPYRDYVIRAFNENKPFDQFTVEQLAGDLLPEATLQSRVASTYNRLNRASAEGGVQPKEYLAKYAADRVRTTGTVWLGSTIGCAECHDHKFDPFTAKDFYQFAAFFADIKELGIVPGAEHVALLPVPTPSQQDELDQLSRNIAAAEQAYRQRTPERLAAFRRWCQSVLDAETQSPVELHEIVSIDEQQRSEPQREQLWAAFLEKAPELADQRKQLAALRAARKRLEQSIPTTLATQATEPRTVRVLPRGNWMDDSGEIVEPAVPHFLPQPDGSERRLTRLDLANWLVARRNPLVARTFVNRLWMLFFGHGLCRTVDDLGSQGQWPTHPQLLDWLAVEFVESGWDVQHVIRQLVLSNTYRQRSAATPALRTSDPFNRLFARQTVWRLDAEFVRDNALAVSGLLARDLGGASVKPYQPAGYWAQLNFPKRTYAHDTGSSQYRRGLYTHWQRTFLHPSLLAFDAPPREECTARRARSNTPMQALALLNDPTYVEAARVLAANAVRDGGSDFLPRLRWLYDKVLSRAPREQEIAVLRPIYQHSLSEYQRSPEAADKLLATGLAPPPAQQDAVELAAWTAVARAILNLHETITRY